MQKSIKNYIYTNLKAVIANRIMAEQMTIRIGHRLLCIRERKQQSQATFAELLNMSTSAYARLERDETPIEFEKIPSIANTLQVPIQDLLPESIAINNNNTGDNCRGFSMGAFFFYTNTMSLETENKFLKEKIALLEEYIRVLKSPKTA